MLEIVLIPYLGGAIGQSQAREMDADPIPGYTITVDDTGDTIKLVGGLEITRNLAIEASLFDLGEYTFRFRGPEIVDGRIEVGGLSLSAVGQLPLGAGVSLNARAGLARWYLDETISGTIPEINGTESVSGTSPVYGIGVSWDIKRVRLSLVGERYKDIGDPVVTGETDVDSITIGAAFKFR